MKYLYLKQKVFAIRDRYKIYDVDQQPVYYCDSRLFSFVARRDLHRASDKQKLFIIKKKLLTILPKYRIYDLENNVVSQINKKLTLFVHKFLITSKMGDLKIEGDIFAHDFIVKKDEEIIVEVHKKWIAWGDTYEISIHDEENIDLLVALVIVLDHACHNQRRRNRSSGSMRRRY
jgi:uncharacterized protein YxjI